MGQYTGCVLIAGLLLISTIGKSYYFQGHRRLWTLQMGGTALLVLVGLLHLAVCVPHLSKKQRLSMTPDPYVMGSLCLLLLSASVSCAVQEQWHLNAAFLAVHAASIAILFVYGSYLVSTSGASQFLDAVVVPIGIASLIGIAGYTGGLHWARWYPGRLNGVFANAIIAGQMSAVAALYFLWRILYQPSCKPLLWRLLFLFATAAVILTRTRTDIAGMCMGVSVCLLMIRRVKGSLFSPVGARQFAVILVMAGVLLLLLQHLAENVGSDAMRDYFRLEDDLTATVSNRLPYWQQGLARLSAGNMLGEGPLAKFGNDVSLAHSGYDRDSNTHNAFFSVIQYYGVSGGILYALFIALLFRSLLNRKDPLGVLGMTILAFGLVQSVSENWLLSFGTPSDLYSWLVLGLCCAPGSSCPSCRIVTNSSRRRPAHRYGTCTLHTT